MKELDIVGVLVDTWGYACSHEDCAEIRTVGLEMYAESEGEAESVAFAFCAAHLSMFLDDVVFSRSVAGLVDGDGKVVELF